MDTARWPFTLPERQDKPGQDHHQHNPHKYKGNNDGSNDYRSESFHRSLFLDYVLCLEPTGTAGPVPVGRSGMAPKGTSAEL
jgi:hypothetical protein